jgi:hypothetical protein
VVDCPSPRFALHEPLVGRLKADWCRGRQNILDEAWRTEIDSQPHGAPAVRARVGRVRISVRQAQQS